MSATRDGKMWRCQFYYENWQGMRHKKNKRGFKTCLLYTSLLMDGTAVKSAFVLLSTKVTKLCAVSGTDYL